RTLLRVAGYPYEFSWVGEGEAVGRQVNIDYGPHPGTVSAPVRIHACGEPFTEASGKELRGAYERGGVWFLDFGRGHNGNGAHPAEGDTLKFSNDIIFASFWLLTGARESHYARDRWDNLQLEGTPFLEHSLFSKPLVSLYGALLGEHLKRRGHAPLARPWASGQAEAAFVLSHDVDYPQIIRWIESLRLLRSRGLKGLRSIAGVLRGTNHFWKFADWVEFEKELGTRPAFYFMARKGSLWQYATGTPDGFYDVRAPEFAELFRYLVGEGCEVGLHASYHAHRCEQQLRREKELLEAAAGVRVEGNRHHYWHLDPSAPHDTLRKQERAGLVYDSSLAFEFYPGFRRGICHPFRVFHPGERRELNL
ncbi:MAG: polysaccharide deacetylase family protein, partial [Pyrinomonadaceae bacterium]